MDDMSVFGATSEQINEFRSKREKPSTTTKVRTRKDIPRPGPKDRFLKGPIPMDWLRAADTCGRRSLSVAVLIWFAAGIQRDNPVRLSNTVLAELGIRPKTARRILLQMKATGIVDVEFHRGRSPLVTIRELPQHA